jgi:hypothetical protein
MVSITTILLIVLGSICALILLLILIGSRKRNDHSVRSRQSKNQLDGSFDASDENYEEGEEEEEATNEATSGDFDAMADEWEDIFTTA